MSSGLEEFRNKVVEDFHQSRDGLLRRVQSLVPEARVHDIALYGSYRYPVGHPLGPTEESDVDLAIHHRGNMTDDQVYDSLSGQLYGLGGFYDIIPLHDNNKGKSLVEKWYM